MNAFDLLVLIVYLMILAYFYSSIVEELDRLTAISLDQAQLKRQLEQYGWAEILGVKFDFGRSPLTDILNSFKITLENKSPAQYFAIHWDQSSLTDFDGISQRLIRIPPGLHVDLFQAQTSSVIAPREILEGKLTVENCLKLDDKNRFEIYQPIFTADLLKEARDENFEFELNLMIQVSDPASRQFIPVLYPLACSFKVVKQPWQKAVYWRPKKSKEEVDKQKKAGVKDSRKARKQAKEASLSQQNQTKQDIDTIKQPTDKP